MYEAIKTNDTAQLQAVLMNALETVKFGRNNYGCPDSNSDVEPPALYIRAILDLGYLTYREFAFMLWKLEDLGANYTDTLVELRTLRSSGTIELGEEANKYADCKPIMILARWGFLSEDESDTTGGKHIIIAPEVLEKYEARLRNLKIYNIDMDCDQPIVDDEANDLSTDEYLKAAQIIKDHISENGLVFNESEEEIASIVSEFREKFAPDKLEALNDDALLHTMFYTNDASNDSLCYWLEFHPQVKVYFGSIAGGSALKFGLYQHKEDGIWYTGSPVKQESLSNEQALELGKHIRDCLVRGAHIIGEAQLESPEDYEILDELLNKEIGKYAGYAWFQKYFQMIYPDKITIFYSSDWQNHVLYSLGIRPCEKSYVKNGQINIVKKHTGLNNVFFGDAFYDKFGGVKHFLRLGSSDEDGKYAADWKKKKIVAIGWPQIGSLEEFRQGNNLNKKAVFESLLDKYYKDDNRIASRKAGEILSFYNANADSIFTVMDGEKLISFVDEPGEYYFDEKENMAHCRPGTWHLCFSPDEELPNKAEGHLTTCIEMSDPDNLLYLYKKYYFDSDELEVNTMNDEKPYVPVNYDTGLKTDFPLNRIVFGAPGTGKSFELEVDRKKLLNDETTGDYERVTFHPDYTYAQFVGTYKPVMYEADKIGYDFVPGPFMRIYVEALKNSREDDPQPYILLIEEINRAKVAAVFGDIFQLLDRTDNGISMYEIQASEDIRKFLAKELGGHPDNYKKIMLPNNMFIWATMNSADQGVFPMDTAFKRRWDFEYLGIDANDEKVVGTVDLIEGNSDSNISWNRFRKAINEKLAREYKVNEDKLLGPYFLSNSVIATNSETDNAIKDPEKFRSTFKSKVLMYLYEDAGKQHKHKLFAGCDSTKYSAVCDAFDEMGMNIFGESFKEDYYDHQEG